MKNISDMIKKLSLLAAALLIPASIFAQQTSDSQDPYFGVRLSFDVTHPAGSNDGINNGSGLTIMGIYNLQLKNQWFLEPGIGVFYNTMGIRPVEFDDGLYDGSIRNIGMRVPLNVGYRFNLFDNCAIALTTGPWFNVNISSKAYLDPNFERPAPSKSTALFDYGWKRFDMQWGLGLSITCAGQYYISVSGGIGVTPMAKFRFDHSHSTIRRNTVSIAIGYNF